MRPPRAASVSPARMRDMRRVTDFRTAELRIPPDRFPLPARVEELLRIYSGLGRWEGSPHAPGSVAIFELPVYRLEEIEAAMLEDVAGDDQR
jgi:hypothetical protein